MPRLATIITCLLIAILLVAFVVLPKYREYSDANLKIKMKNIDIENQQKYFSQIKDTSEKLKNYSEELKKINYALPKEPFLPEVLDFLAQASSQNGMTFRKLTSSSVASPKAPAATASSSPTPESEKSKISPKLKEINVEFEVSGNYSSLKNFISTLEKSARLIEIESITFSSSQTKTAEETSPTFVFKIKTYSF
jgi:Tfp pilus assembly protein PilO